MDTMQLVCEGSCNPGLSAWDAGVAYQRPAPHTLLNHTPHIFVKRQVFKIGSSVKDDRVQVTIMKCKICGRERRLGWDVPWDHQAERVDAVDPSWIPPARN